MNTAEKLCKRLNGLLGGEIVSLYDNDIYVETAEDHYMIMCEDNADAHNTILAMIDGIELYKEVKGV